jgi:hypothetical protein
MVHPDPLGAMSRTALSDRERIEQQRVTCWLSYLGDTRRLRGAAYEDQEMISWRRLKVALAGLKADERKLKLEDDYRRAR